MRNQQISHSKTRDGTNNHTSTEQLKRLLNRSILVYAYQEDKLEPRRCNGINEVSNKTFTIDQIIKMPAIIVNLLVHQLKGLCNGSTLIMQGQTRSKKPML